MTTKRLLSFFIFFTLLSESNAQTLLNESFLWDGNNREYAVYIPASYDGSVEFPLLFNFHGGGDFIASYMSSVNMRPIADTANFILVYPQAIPDPGNGGSTSWMHKPPTTHDDVPFVQAMIDSISADYNINPDRVYACGYSLGGEFTYELGCQLNDKIAAIGAVARTMGTETYNNCSPVHPTGVMTILGTADPISDYNGVWYLGVQYYMSAAEVHDYWVNYNNCETNAVTTNVPDINTSDGTTVERNTWSTTSGCAYVEELKVIGGGHDWPGSFGNMDIDASQEIWNFVSRYDLNGLIECTTTISEPNSSQINYRVYPNPFVDQLSIETDFDYAKEFKIYSILGELMISGIISSDINTINLSSLAKNIYILKIEDQTIMLVKK